MDSLVAAIAAGDPAAFASWMRGAERPIRDSLRGFAASVDTEAVLQETLLRIWQVAPRFEPDGRPNGLMRLAIRIAHNLAISEVRRTGRAVPGEPAALERALEAELERAGSHAQGLPDPLLRQRLQDCRERRLPGKPRQALDARLENAGAEPDAVLAARLAMQKNTFLQNVTRARRLLVDCLRAHGIDLAELELELDPSEGQTP
jgi:RNA polymerase sigma-70 factor (ECF subfamily)